MRTFRHWSPRYIKNRIKEAIYHRTHPHHPWLTRAANEFLESYLTASDKGLELGSGRSTLWFANRVAHLTSLEHDEVWYNKVKQMLKDADRTNVEYHLVREENERTEPTNHAYVKFIDRFDTSSMDFVLVDGAYRDLCARKAMRVIRPGGMLIIDNVNWYLPSCSHSPGSRLVAQGPEGEAWKEIHEALADWRRIWTSSGVTDTAIFIKPCS